MSAARLVRPLALLAGVAGVTCLLAVVLLGSGPVAVLSIVAALLLVASASELG